MRSVTAGRIEASEHPDWAPGDLVCGLFGWQDYAAVDATSIGPGTLGRRVTETDLPLSLSIGVLGLNGLTAYFGLLEVGAPRPGETVVVSTAAGAVGSAVGQIAHLNGCRTVGIAGGPVKVRQCLEEFGFDAAIDYRASDLPARLREACPEGIDVYFDNTAGAIADAVLAQLAVGARVVVCGTASIADWNPIPFGPRVERHLLVKRARMQGFLIFDWTTRFPGALRRLADWVRSGRLRYREEVLDGIEHAPDAIAGLYRGENLGRRLIRIAPG
jgi:NADPH-dependent curcumin reductase CurA